MRVQSNNTYNASTSGERAKQYHNVSFVWLYTFIQLIRQQNTKQNANRGAC